jgi:potassium/chloride transporter 9
LILQLGVILNTVPAWKKSYKLRVIVFVEYESDVEEERGRVQSLLENLRIEAEVVVLWLASGKLPTYEIVVNGAEPSKKSLEEVEDCLSGQEWWDEIQKIRGKRGPTSGTEDLSEIASIFTTGSAWPEASFQQGPRDERIERFLGLRRLLRKSKRKHTMSGITKYGVSLNMRTHRLSDNIVRDHATTGSASEDSSSSSEDDSDSDAIETDSEEGSQAAASVVSEGDASDFESSSDSPISPVQTIIRRRRSHGDTMRGPPPSKRSTGEKEVKVPERTSRRPPLPEFPATTSGVEGSSAVSGPGLSFKRSESPNRKPPSISNISTSLQATLEETRSRPTSLKELDKALKEPDKSPLKPDASANVRPASVRSERPSISRHASQPKFTSKPVPMTRVATEDGPGPSIMFTETPSPPIHARSNRLPSAYRPNLSDNISEVSEPQDISTATSHRGSTYSTQALPLSFNDLPCRAQHLILNELMRSKSKYTAVMFTTLPSPVEGTCLSVEASAGYLSDLEVLCKDCPPVLMVHSNSMTVTMSL